MNAVGSEDSDVAVVKEEHVPGVAEDRGHVRGDEIFLIAEADDYGRAGTCRDNLIRFRFCDDRDREDPGQLLRGLAHSIFKRDALSAVEEMLLDQVRDNLGVRLRLEDMAVLFEPVLER